MYLLVPTLARLSAAARPDHLGRYAHAPRPLRPHTLHQL